MPEQDESLITAADLPFALYLDQRLVFDVLAALENGFVDFSTVQTSFGETEMNQKSGGLGLGISNAFALVGIQFGAQGSHTTSGIQNEVTTERIVHTPASLFSRLRKSLYERELVRNIEGGYALDSVNPGEFVEFKATLTRNPIEEMFTTIEDVLPLAELSGNADENTRQGGRKRNPQQRNQTKQLSSQLSSMRKSIFDDEFRDLIAELEDVKIVLNTTQKYFIDPTMNNVIDGNFIIFGKVTRVLFEVDEKISLLRRSPLGKFTEAPALLSGLVKGTDLDLHGNTEIEFPAPAMQIIPMAIFS